MKRCTVALMAIVSMSAACPLGSAVVGRNEAWVYSQATTLRKFLLERHEWVSWQVGFDRRKRKVTMTDSYLRHLCRCALAAAKYNPSLEGGGKECAKRHLLAAYGESRFWQEANNISNRNGTWDIGLEQVNSQNWFSGTGAHEWGRFCRMEHLDPADIGALKQPDVNMKYAALINEDMMQSGHLGYARVQQPAVVQLAHRMGLKTEKIPRKAGKKNLWRIL